jgi:hypothetical protein
MATKIDSEKQADVRMGAGTGVGTARNFIGGEWVEPSTGE